MESRPATLDDLETVTEILTAAFASDPVWGGWAFPGSDRVRATVQRRQFWRFLVRSGLRHPWVRITEGGEAAALWIPPGENELTQKEEGELEPFLRDLVGAHADSFLEGLALFEENDPVGTPHYHLDLLATHDDYRGKGLGMELLRENLALIDAEHRPAYLESTNPVNLERYAGVGFERAGEFTLPGGPTVTTMWREAR